MKYAAYEQYKPSRIEWIGAVPEHWGIWKIAHGFQMTGSGTTPPPDNPDWYDGNVCWVTTSELRETVITDTEKKISQEALKNFSALKVFPEGALAIAMYGATIGRLGIFGIEAATNQACGVLFGQKAFDTKFVFYWLQAFREQIILLASGGGQPNISQEKVRSVRIACPSIEEQQIIACFLDAKTAQIDALVAQKRQLIAKLKEKRSALIARTVTRGLPPEAAKAAGLEPNPEMKDSGVDWLGPVPQAWAVVPLKWRARCSSGDGIATDDVEINESVSTSIPVVGGNGLMGYGADSNIDHQVLVIGRVGALCGNVHIIDPPVWITDNALVLRPKPGVFDNRYLAHVLRFRNLNDIAAKTAQPLITGTQVRDQRVPCPSVLEQGLIADFLDSECLKLDGLSAASEAAISRLTEYRQALITSAVTGKIDVRELEQ